MALGIFYYPWYGDGSNVENAWRHWEDNGKNPPTTWNSKFTPDRGLYDSQTLATVNAQMAEIRAAGFNFVIWSWMGQDTFSDHSLNIFWDSGTNPTGLTHCIYYEKEWTEGPVSITDVNSDIDYIKNNYAGSNVSPDPKYFRLNSKAVVFVYNATPTSFVTDTQYQTKLAQKWSTVKTRKAIYTVLKVFGGWKNVSKTADSWHQYAPSSSYARHPPYSSFVSPGFYKTTDSAARLNRDLTRFEANIKSLAADTNPLKLVQTYNEWTEGTGIEPAAITGQSSYGSAYLDIVEKYFNPT